jgi:hypothetical protein
MADFPGERRFSDGEVARILQAAAELEAREPAERGLSLSELERIGSEVGLDPAVVRRAALEVDARDSGPGAGRLLGGPTELVAERVLQGEIGPGAHEALLDALRQETGDLGEVSAIGRQFGWRGDLDAKAKLEVHVAPGEGRTTIRVRVTLDELAADVFGGRFVLIGGGLAFVMVAATVNVLGLAAGLLGGAFAAGGFVAARQKYSWLAARYQTRVSSLVDALARRVSASAPAELPPSAPHRPSGE